MENNGQPPVKQQLTETLREAESVVIATSKNPGRDEIAAAIGLHLLLSKLDMVAEVVITGKIPDELKFLPSDFIHTELQGQRDFVIELDQSSTEADHLKYVTEDNKLKIYITPYNGVFSDKDVNFSYGDYHCDAIIGLGVNDVGQMDDAVTKEQKLIQNAKFLFITNSPGGGNNLVWSDPTASSICEMVMSMSEALGSGMLDKQIATALFAGIVEKTRHFTNASTTPKVMTMAAQLLAAGADQAEVVKQLALETQSQPPREAPDKKEDNSDNEPDKAEQPSKQPQQQPSNEFQIRKNKNASQSQDSGQQQPAPDKGDKPDVKPEPEKSQPPTPPAQPSSSQGSHVQNQQPAQNKPEPPDQPQQNNQPPIQPPPDNKPPDKSPAASPPPETISGTLNMQHEAPPKQPPKQSTAPTDGQQPPQPQPQTSNPAPKDVEIDHTGSPKEKVVNPPSDSQPQAPKPPENNTAANAGSQAGASQPPTGNTNQPSQSPGDGNAPKPPESDALEAARKAVEEAHGEQNQGQNQNQSQKPNNNPPQPPQQPQ